MREHRGVDDIFSDDDDEAPAREGRGLVDEFDDFIEEDEFPDDERERMLEEREVARPGKRLFSGGAALPEGLTEAEFEDMKNAFGDGTEYDWALALQEEMDEDMDGQKELDVKDIFEPAQVKSMMQTDEDREIQAIDVPERYQVARRGFTSTPVSEEQAAGRAEEKAAWVAGMMLPKLRLERHLIDPFKKSVARVLSFINDEDLEIPFVFQLRKDYLVHVSSEEESGLPGGKADRLMSQSDMWDLFELDLKFRAMLEKRDGLQASYADLKDHADVSDPIIEEWLPTVVQIEEVQDIHDYLQFRYGAQLKDVNIALAETNGVQKRAGTSRTVWEKVRASKAYNFVQAIGITADDFAQNVEGIGRRRYTDDPSDRPDDLADFLLDPPDYSTGTQVLRAAKAMFAEELSMNPRLRKWMRRTMYESAYFDCYRTEKGARMITEDHKYYEFKYLRHQDIAAVARRPELFLRMLQAEREGLVQVKLNLGDVDLLKRELYKYIESDNYSEIADAWNAMRREMVDIAFAKIEKIVGKGVKETLKAECETHLARNCRQTYLEKLDQAPFKPRGMEAGTVARTLTLSSGQGVPGRDAICWAYTEDDGRTMETGKFADLRLGNPDKYLPDGKDVQELVRLIGRRKPDVIGVSGFSVQTRKLSKDVQDIVDKFDLRGNEFDVGGDDDDEHERRQTTEKLEVVMVNDEVARLYHESQRAADEFPQHPPLVRYCIALGRYMQSPILEYAALKQDIVSLSFDPNQDLVPQDKLMRYLESAMVEIANVVGVDINDAVTDAYTSNLLPYICGLGPRKAEKMKKAINENGGHVTTRGELVGDDEHIAACGSKVWQNCAGYLSIVYDKNDPDSDYLDSTRVHPEDYDLGRKMAADALEMDEEDIKAEVDEGGISAVVRKLEAEGLQDRVNDLILEEYAEQLERNFNQRKRATLESIRDELISPYEELRRGFAGISNDELYTMLTGETRDSLQEGMIVPVQIRRVFQDHIEVRLDCGIEGGISSSEYPQGVGEGGVDPRQVYTVHQTVQAKILYLSRKNITAQLSFREDALRRPFRREFDHPKGEWDDEQEARDKRAAIREKENVTGRAQRVIKHPNFRPFNSAQAEEYLGSLHRGDVVIRPSSKGLDHLAVTWKVSDNIYQHIDVLELEKDNEFSIGKRLRIDGKFTYSDLDELIASHIKGMARKVDEMMQDDKYQNGSKAQTGMLYSFEEPHVDLKLTFPTTDQWLTTYAEANPKRSMYAFCINPKYPGYFYLCFKAGLHAHLGAWHVKVLPNAFELQKNQYPDMTSLKNGFKRLFMNQQTMPDMGYRKI